jgi:hypothetical protein
LQRTARKRIEKSQIAEGRSFRDVVADMESIYFHDAKLIALVLIADPAAARDRGSPILMEAVYADDESIVRLLLEHGANANSADPA